MKSKNFLALLLIFIGLGFFSCAHCFQLQKKPKLTRTEKIAKKYNENRIKLKTQIENTDKQMQEADSAILVNSAEIQNSQSIISTRSKNLKKLDNAVKNFGIKTLSDEEEQLFAEIFSSALSAENAEVLGSCMKNPAGKLTEEQKTMLEEALSLYKLESETQINTLNAYITQLQEEIFVKREERKKLAMQKDELAAKLLEIEEQCDEIGRKIAAEKEEAAVNKAGIAENPETPPKVTVAVIVPPNAFKFVKFEPDIKMFELQLRNSSIFLPAAPAIQPEKEENVVQVALNDDYSLELLDEKPVVWRKEDIQPENEPSAAPQKPSNELSAVNASTAIVYCFEKICGLNPPSKIHNSAMTEALSEIKKYKVLNLNTYFTFSPEEIICPEKFYE